MSPRPWIASSPDVEIVVLVAVAVVLLAAGIRVGILVAPRIERMADRMARAEPADPDGSSPPPSADEGAE